MASQGNGQSRADGAQARSPAPPAEIPRVGSHEAGPEVGRAGCDLDIGHDLVERLAVGRTRAAPNRRPGSGS